MQIVLNGYIGAFDLWRAGLYLLHCPGLTTQTLDKHAHHSVFVKFNQHIMLSNKHFTHLKK